MTKNRPRVAIVAACPYPTPGGSQLLVKTCADALSSAGNDVRIVAYGHGAGTHDDRIPLHRGPRLRASNTGAGPTPLKPLLDVALVPVLRRIVREHSVDVIHAHNIEALIVALAARVRPVVYHAHTAMAEELPYYVSRWLGGRAIGGILDRSLPRRADHVVALHAAQAEYLIACGCSAARVSILPPPFAPGPAPRSLRQPPTPTVLYTGTLESYQNLSLLDAAMSRVREAIPTARLVVATHSKGSLPGSDLIDVNTENQLYEVLHQEAVFACPRVAWAGFPMKLLNAMAAGLAIVACSSSAHGLTHEYDALIAPDNDPTTFADALIAALRDVDLRRRLGANARRTLEANHAPHTFATRMNEIYSSVLLGAQPTARR